MLRLWCQGLFGEGVALGGWLAICQVRRRRLGRAALPALAALALMGVYWEAYHREPWQLRVRRHELRIAAGTGGARRLRILHLTDIQAATIGEHEARALRAGLLERPGLIVFTGDYIHERVGAHTGGRFAADLNADLAHPRLKATREDLVEALAGRLTLQQTTFFRIRARCGDTKAIAAVGCLDPDRRLLHAATPSRSLRLWLEFRSSSIPTGRAASRAGRTGNRPSGAAGLAGRWRVLVRPRRSVASGSSPRGPAGPSA